MIYGRFTAGYQPKTSKYAHICDCEFGEKEKRYFVDKRNGVFYNIINDNDIIWLVLTALLEGGGNTVIIKNKSKNPGVPQQPLGIRLKRYRYFYLMFLPVLVWYIMFHYVPIYGLVMAFQDFSYAKGFAGSSWAGLKHFRALFADPYFRRAFRNTVIIALYRVIFCCSFEIIVALLLNELRAKWFRKPVQTIMYIPHFLSWVIVASIFLTFLSPERGILRPIAEFLSIKTPTPLTTASQFRAVLIAVAMWKETGFGTILYIAAIAGIDPGLYEAAVIDGASRWQQLKYVTLPGIKSTIVTLIILNLGQCLKWGFDEVYNLYNRLVYDTGDIVDTFIVRTAMADNRYSYAAAAGFLMSLMCMIILLIANKVMKKVAGHSIY